MRFLIVVFDHCALCKSLAPFLAFVEIRNELSRVLIDDPQQLLDKLFHILIFLMTSSAIMIGSPIKGGMEGYSVAGVKGCAGS
jgi:hypothetical protein